MQAFKFRLASLLSLRLSERDSAHRAVAEAVQAIGILEAQILDKDKAIADLKIKRAEALTGRLSVDHLLSQGRYEMVFEQDKAKLQQQIAHIQLELEKRRSVLRAADQEVKRIEKLRDHALQTYRNEERTQMQAEMDEAAAVLHRSVDARTLGT